MEAARNAVHKITSKVGHHTDVDETVNPAITRETVKPTRHEETTAAVDREVHQDHYHTTVQPLAHSETLPEQHTHQQLPVQEKEYRHGDHDAVKQKVATELGAFQNTSTTNATKHTSSVAPTVAGEHVHHHVHETVQPVIHKETIQPEVVHTTVPIHEVHHAEAQHHGMSVLPTKNLSDFSATPAKTATESYTGPPKHYNENMQTTLDKVLHPTGHNTSTNQSHLKRDSGIDVQKKPSLADKLNPKIDADGDGKAGIMD